MSDDEFDKIRQLFVEALEIPENERESWLRATCTNNEQLGEVLSLLAQSSPDKDPLERGVLKESSTAKLPAGFPDIPGYRIIDRLSVGGQGVVYRAIQQSTNQQVAVKLLRLGEASSAIEKDRFVREASVLARLHHPHIVPVIDRGETATGISYLVTQFIDGWPVDEYVKEKITEESDDPTELLSLFVKVVEAVEAAHKFGVIHRDLKPSNILVDQNGEPRLLDFGLAKLISPAVGIAAVDQITATGHFLGSLPWASPEQAAGLTQNVDQRTDVYSLGVILYQILTKGGFPYPVVGSIRDVMENILNAAPQPLSDAMNRPASSTAHTALAVDDTTRTESARIHPSLEGIVLKALAKSPDMRYQSAGELACEIRAYLTGEQITQRFPLVWPGRRRLLKRLGAISGCLLLVVVVIWSVSDLGPSQVSSNDDSTVPETAAVQRPEHPATRSAASEIIVDFAADESDGDFSAGDLSLREAIEITNERAGHDTILFDVAADNLTIAVTGGELTVADTVSIDGPGADRLTVRSNSGGLFHFSGPVKCAVSGLTMVTDGAATAGTGTIRVSDVRSTLDIVDCVIFDRSASATSGGGLRITHGCVRMTNVELRTMVSGEHSIVSSGGLSFVAPTHQQIVKAAILVNETEDLFSFDFQEMTSLAARSTSQGGPPLALANTLPLTLGGRLRAAAPTDLEGLQGLWQCIENNKSPRRLIKEIEGSTETITTTVDGVEAILSRNDFELGRVGSERLWVVRRLPGVFSAYIYRVLDDGNTIVEIADIAPAQIARSVRWRRLQQIRP